MAKSRTTTAAVLLKLKAQADPKVRAAMVRFGVHVKKAVNWALRQIGKRNRRLNRLAIRAAKRIRGMDSSAARWVAADALRELTSPGVQRRLSTRARSRA